MANNIAASVAVRCLDLRPRSKWSVLYPSGHAVSTFTRASLNRIILTTLFLAHAAAVAMQAAAGSVGVTAPAAYDRHGDYGLRTFQNAVGAAAYPSSRNLHRQYQQSQQQRQLESVQHVQQGFPPCTHAHSTHSAWSWGWITRSLLQVGAISITPLINPNPNTSLSFISPPVTPGPVPQFPSVPPSPASQSPAVPPPSPPQQSPGSTARLGHEQIAAIPENATQQEGALFREEAPPDTVTVNMILQGVTEEEFQTRYRTVLVSFTAELSGTPEGGWKLTTNQLLQLRQQTGRRLLYAFSPQLLIDHGYNQRQLLQLRQGLAVSLSLYTSKPHLVWYRLKQRVQPATTRLAAAAEAASGLPAQEGEAAVAPSRFTEYSARLIRAGVPVDTNSITVSPDYGRFLAGDDSANAEHQQKGIDSKLKAGIVVWSVIGFVLLVGTALQSRRIVACCMCGDGSRRYLDVLAADSAKFEQKQAKQAHVQGPFYEPKQKPDDDIDHDLIVCQTLSDISSSSSEPLEMLFPAVKQMRAAGTYATATAAAPEPELDMSDHGKPSASAPNQGSVGQTIAAAGPFTLGVASLTHSNSAEKRKAASAAAAAAAENLVISSPTNSSRSPASPKPCDHSTDWSSTHNTSMADTPTYAGFQPRTPSLISLDQYAGSPRNPQNAQPPALNLLGFDQLEPVYNMVPNKRSPGIAEAPAGSSSSNIIADLSSGQLTSASRQHKVPSPKRVSFCDPVVLEPPASANGSNRSDQQSQSTDSRVKDHDDSRPSTSLIFGWF